ncbi:hypothetical protein [Endozoicomonas numazuensis]|nr:hypothetical protein [Endozoicomonas numazuensis]
MSGKEHIIMSIGKPGQSVPNQYVDLKPQGPSDKPKGIASHPARKLITESSKEHHHKKSVKDRDTEVIAVPNGAFARLKAFILRRPEPAEIHRTQELIEALSSKSDDLSAPMTFKDRSATIDKGSPVHAACAWLAEVGLLKMAPSPSGEVTVKMLRPRKLKVQSETARKLSELMPAQLGKDGTLQLRSMLRNVEHRRLNDLQISGLLTFDASRQKHVVNARSRQLMKFDRCQDQFDNRMAAPRMYWAGRFRALANSDKYDEEVKPSIQEISNKFRNNTGNRPAWINKQDADSQAEYFREAGCPELASEVLQAKQDCP